MLCFAIYWLNAFYINEHVPLCWKGSSCLIHTTNGCTDEAQTESGRLCIRGPTGEGEVLEMGGGGMGVCGGWLCVWGLCCFVLPASLLVFLSGKPPFRTV